MLYYTNANAGKALLSSIPVLSQRHCGGGLRFQDKIVLFNFVFDNKLNKHCKISIKFE